MKVSLLSRSLNIGGAERQMSTLACGLQARGHTVSLSTFYSGGALEAEIVGQGVEYLPLNKTGRWDVQFLASYKEYLAQAQPDVVYSFLGTPNLLSLVLKPLFPKTKFVWGLRAAYMDLSKYSFASKLTYKAEAFFSRIPDLVISNSHAGKTMAIERGFPSARIEVVANGIDTSRFRPNRENGKRFRESLGIATDQTLIGLVGRLDPMKDHASFLRAAAMLVRERNDLAFVCAGGGTPEVRNHLVGMSESLNLGPHVKWIGAQADMPSVYNGLDALCSSSYGEGFPNVIGEAMACGVPCVVTDVGDSAWIVGPTGIVVPPRDPERLVEGIIACLEQSKAEVGQTVRQRIVDNFSLDRLVTRTEEVLEALLHGNLKERTS